MRAARQPDDLRRIYDRIAHAYDRRHRRLTFGHDGRARRLLVSEAVRAGDRVLDAGAGTGSTSLLAAEAAGAQGHVTALDLSPGMLAQARRKAEAAALSDRMGFVEGDFARLPFADGAFDVVLTTFSLCPLVDPAAAALELYRVLKPGGRLGAAHSASPANPLLHWLSERLEDAIWPIPSISMGCRAVEVLPQLTSAGARLVFERRIGIPLYPFEVFVLEKPAG